MTGKSQNFPRRGRVGEKKIKILPTGTSFVLPKHTNSCQNVQIPRQNDSIPRHGEKKDITFLAGAGLT